MQIARDSIPMIKARPLIGWGLGTFTTVYPKYRSFYASVFINAAHNDYVQLLTETGALAFAAVLGFLAMVYARGFRKLRGPGLDLTQAATLAALLGITGILVHSFVDFNLQIPANAAMFYVAAELPPLPFPPAADTDGPVGQPRRSLRCSRWKRAGLLPPAASRA